MKRPQTGRRAAIRRLDHDQQGLFQAARYVDLEQITPNNVGNLKEICEIGSTNRLCAALLNKRLNGDRTPNDLLIHITDEPLVNWAYNPSTRPNGEPRTIPPLSHDALIQAFKQWMAEGVPCANS
jgi:hypothetical protein